MKAKIARDVNSRLDLMQMITDMRAAATGFFDLVVAALPGKGQAPRYRVFLFAGPVDRDQAVTELEPEWVAVDAWLTDAAGTSHRIGVDGWDSLEARLAKLEGR